MSLALGQAATDRLTEHESKAMSHTKFVHGIFEAGQDAWRRELAKTENRFGEAPQLRSIDAPHMHDR